MDNDEGEAGKVEGPAGLSTGKFLLAREVDQITMICPNFNRAGMSLQVVTKVFKGKNDCKEFLIVDFVVAFRRL